MAVGDSGRPVSGTVQFRQPQEFASRVGKHIHKGDADSTVGGPGATSAPGASQQGASGQSPYGSGGDGN
jgi:hypothetical protein